MKKYLITAACFAGVAVVWATWAPREASAITGGVVDEQNHYSNVGAIVVVRPPESQPDFKVPKIVCTGTLIHPQVFLTAGHCTADIEDALENGIITLANIRVSFSADAFDKRSWLEVADVVTHPGFRDQGANPPDINDVGVLILKQPQKKLPLATLPREGLLDFLKAAGELREPPGATEFTVVGYGSRLDHPPPKVLEPDGFRRVAASEYLALRKDYLIMSQNFATGDGGTGFGDSGGPTFWTAPDGTEVLVAITSRGDPKLVSTGFAYRTDIPPVLDFIDLVIDMVEGNLP